jgi:uncharacterized protein (TIGR03083 family)
MDRDDVWRAIDEERRSLADLFDDLSPQEWETRSLCAGWRVRDVAAHLTLAQMSVLPAMGNLVRARGGMNRMIRDTAVRQARLPVEQYGELLRRMVGSRRTAPGVSHVEPLLDALVHGQDVAIPLARPRSMPLPAAAVAASRAWELPWPFWARRRFRGLSLQATDEPWTAGEGPRIEGPLAALLLVLTGRSAGLAQLSGPGLPELEARLARRGVLRPS